MLGVGGPLGRCCDSLTLWVLRDNSSLKTAPLRSEKLTGRLLYGGILAESAWRSGGVGFSDQYLALFGQNSRFRVLQKYGDSSRTLQTTMQHNT